MKIPRPRAHGKKLQINFQWLDSIFKLLIDVDVDGHGK